MKAVHRAGVNAAIGLGLVAAALVVATLQPRLVPLIPSVLALALVVILRRAATAIWAGALVGLWLAADLSLTTALDDSVGIIAGIFTPGGWKFYAMIFTLLMGGFSVMLEGNGSFERLVGQLLQRFRDRRKSVEWTTYGAGMLCFFDGLASCVIVGRLMRRPAERAGVSGAKLAYLVDTTGSCVTCLAFVSTWIAFQLGMIAEGLRLAGWEGNPYGIFFRTIPFNFYCLLSLAIAFVAIRWSWNPGPMSSREAATDGGTTENLPASPDYKPRPVAAALSDWRLLPLPILVACLFIGMYWSGSGGRWPNSIAAVGDAFGAANAGLVLVLSSVVGVICVWLTFPVQRWFAGDGALKLFGTGVATMVPPIFILIGAWVLGSTLERLGTAGMLVSLMGNDASPAFLVPAIFLIAALTGVTTGTSWGTIGILLPIAIPVLASVGIADGASDPLVPLVVSAVFGGAVFGDHCSPLSDTTIVSAAACGIDTREHALTQAPYAIAAAGGTLLLYAFAALLA